MFGQGYAVGFIVGILGGYAWNKLLGEGKEN